MTAQEMIEALRQIDGAAPVMIDLGDDVYEIDAVSTTVEMSKGGTPYRPIALLFSAAATDALPASEEK